MRKEYDFSNSKKNPYVKKIKKQVTMRAAKDTIDFAQTLCYVKGIWKDRNDIKSAENYVRKLRVDRRPK